MPRAWTERDGGFLRMGPSQFCITKGPMTQQYHKRSLDKCQAPAHCSFLAGFPRLPGLLSYSLHFPPPTPRPPHLIRGCVGILEGLSSTLPLSVIENKAYLCVRKQSGIITLQTGKAGHYPEASPEGWMGLDPAQKTTGNSHCLVFHSTR